MEESVEYKFHILDEGLGFFFVQLNLLLNFDVVDAEAGGFPFLIVPAVAAAPKDGSFLEVVAGVLAFIEALNANYRVLFVHAFQAFEGVYSLDEYLATQVAFCHGFVSLEESRQIESFGDSFIAL